MKQRVMDIFLIRHFGLWFGPMPCSGHIGVHTYYHSSMVRGVERSTQSAQVVGGDVGVPWSDARPSRGLTSINKHSINARN